MAPNMASQVRSAADAIETAIPQNCSVGTKQFCVGFPHKFLCYSLPLNVSKIIPTNVENLVQINLNDIRPLTDALAKVTTASIQDALVIGVTFIFIMSALSICTVFGRFLCLTAILLRFRILKVGTLLLLGLICCSPFLVATIVLYIVKSKTEHLPPWIQVEEGEVSRTSVEGLCCAIVMLVFSTIIALLF
jgi:hypothetical protein